MQPDEKKNYWEKETESEKPTDMYEPKNEDDSIIDSNSDVQDEEVFDNPNEDDEPVHWRASEYIHESKSGLWFTIFAIIVVSFIAIDIFYIKAYTFSVLVIVMAIAVIIFSRRPPKEIDYTLSGRQGLYVGEKLYHFSEFKAFGLIRDRGQHSIMLIPVKRFAPGVSVYFPEKVGEKIVDILGARLPMENLKLDVIDVIVHKLHL